MRVYANVRLVKRMVGWRRKDGREGGTDRERGEKGRCDYDADMRAQKEREQIDHRDRVKKEAQRDSRKRSTRRTRPQGRRGVVRLVCM